MTDTITAPAEPVAKVTESAPESVTPDTNREPIAAESENESSEPKTENEGGEEQKSKPKVGFKERISQIHAQKKEAEAHAKSAWSVVARLQDEIKTLRSTDPNSLPFEQQDAHRLREVVKAERFEEAVATARNAEAGAERARVETFKAKVEAARDRMPDFDAVFTPDVPVTRVGAEMIAESEKAAELAYYLGQNRREAYEISQLPEWRQAAELARIEAKLSAAPPVRKISQAPQPVATLQGKSAGSATKDPAEMSEKEYIAWRKSQWAKGQK
jgi:hypothetical protein